MHGAAAIRIAGVLAAAGAYAWGLYVRLRVGAGAADGWCVVVRGGRARVAVRAGRHIAATKNIAATK